MGDGLPPCPRAINRAATPHLREILLGVLIPNGCAVGAAFAACNAASECNHRYPRNLATSMPAFYTGQKEQTAEQSKLR